MQSERIQDCHKFYITYVSPYGHRLACDFIIESLGDKKLLEEYIKNTIEKIIKCYES